MMRRLVKYLIRLFPADFRDSYGADMLATFDDRWRERPGLGAAARMLIDLVQSAWLERRNPNYKGGAITGGVADALQLFNRPVTRLDPYSTPNPRLFICSAATPPGGGVHGMCGYWAAQSVLSRLDRRSAR